MSYRFSVYELEDRLRILSDAIDEALEQEFGPRYELHPSRPKDGTTANSANDGLFHSSFAFSPGFGSIYGRGYHIKIIFSTLQPVLEEDRIRAHDIAKCILKELLPHHFDMESTHLVEEATGLKLISSSRFAPPSL